jgi:hypothetical protein
MDRRFTIREDARAEVTERHGELAAISVYQLWDRRPGWAFYIAVGGNDYISLWDDQVVEER